MKGAFWNKKLGVLGALGSVATFLCTVAVIPFMPDGGAPSAGGFPAMVGNLAFLMKDVVLLAVSVYLLKQDVLSVVAAAPVDKVTAPSTVAPAVPELNEEECSAAPVEFFAWVARAKSGKWR
jgi:hypothetical protein